MDGLRAVDFLSQRARPDEFFAERSQHSITIRNMWHWLLPFSMLFGAK
jgi:hypothetical protein